MGLGSTEPMAMQFRYTKTFLFLLCRCWPGVSFNLYLVSNCLCKVIFFNALTYEKYSTICLHSYRVEKKKKKGPPQLPISQHFFGCKFGFSSPLLFRNTAVLCSSSKQVCLPEQWGFCIMPKNSVLTDTNKIIGGVWRGRFDHKGRKLWMACLRGSWSLYSTLVSRRQHFTQLHKSNLPCRGLHALRYKHDDGLCFDHRRLCVQVHDRPMLAWKVN